MTKSIGTLFADLGLALAAAARYAEAESALQQALAEDRDADFPYAEVCEALGRTYEALGKPDAAYDIYRQLAAELPRRHDHAAAEAILRRMLALNPADVETLESLGWALYNQNKTAESLNVFLEGAGLREEWAPFHSGLGLTYVRLGNYEEALREFDRALALDPEDREALLGKGTLLRQVGDLQGSLTVLRRLAALTADPQYTFELGMTYQTAGESALAVGAFVETARQLLEQGQPQAAQAVAERAIYQLDPNASEAHLLRGLALYAQDRYAEAIEALKQALALAPSAEVHYRLAQAYHESEQFDLALGAINQALELRPDWPVAQAQKGAILRHLECYDAALQLLDEVLAQEPDSPWTHAERGAVLSDLGRTEEALEAFRTAISLEPEYFYANAQLGMLLVGAGRYAEALPVLEYALTLDPDVPLLHYFQGVAWYNLDQYAEALAAFDAVLQHDIGNAEAGYYRGACLRLLGRFEEAITALQATVDLELANNAAQPRTYGELGEALRMAGRHREAVEAFRRAVEIAPEYQWALARYGETLRFLGQHAEALGLLERAVALNDSDFWALGSLGATYSALERQRSALLTFDRALALSPQYVWAWAWKGVVLRQAHRYAEAVQALERALERESQLAWLHGEKGLALRQLGAYDRAASSLLQALELDPGYAWGQGQLAGVNYLLGNDAAALEHAERALAQDPSLLWVQQVRSAALQRLGREEEAAAAHAAGLADPESFQAYLDRGDTYAALLAFDQAIADFEHALQLAPDRPEPYNTLAWLYADTMGTRLEEATALAERAVQLASQLEDVGLLAPALDTLGWTYCKRGLFAEALPHLERAVSLSDEALLTQDHLEFCRQRLGLTPAA